MAQWKRERLHNPNARRSRAPKGARERGAILVEFVFVVPLFMTLVLGIFEIGKAWEANQTVVQASRSGARTVSQLGKHEQADREAVLAVVSAFGPDAGDIVRITIFQAEPDGKPAANCAVGANPTCNVYTQVQIAQVGDSSLWGCSSPKFSSGWDPCVRNNLQRDATYVGVTVEFEEQYQTGFFGGGTYTITESAVMRIEPDAGS